MGTPSARAPTRTCERGRTVAVGVEPAVGGRRAEVELGGVAVHCPDASQEARGPLPKALSAPPLLRARVVVPPWAFGVTPSSAPLAGADTGNMGPARSWPGPKRGGRNVRQPT